VDLGVLGQATVALYRTDRRSTTYHGVVVLPAANRALPLPPMYEADGRFDIEVASVFAMGPASGPRALVVLYRYYQLGSGADGGHAGYVYQWNGTAWAIDDPRSRQLVGAANAGEARARLKAPAQR
jgi:hypothetical protein